MTPKERIAAAEVPLGSICNMELEPIAAAVIGGTFNVGLSTKKR